MAAKRPLNSGVTVRMFDPGTGWTLDEARALLGQGYSLEHVVARTGWPRPMVLAGRRPQRREYSAAG